jgi:hypothetical protein
MTTSTEKLKYLLVEVIWTDAEECGSVGWNDPEETLAESKVDCPTVHSVGYVLHDSESHISLIRSYHDNGMSSVEKIPKGFIRLIRALL